MSFLESPRFPEHIGQYSTGGPCFQTDIVRLMSGMEQRNATWSTPLHRFDITSGIQTREDLMAVLAFFKQVRGRSIGFRFKDPLDFSSSLDVITPTDQLIGIGDGETQRFQLIKTTALGELKQVRVIQKPVPGTVMVAVNSMTKDVDIDFTTGLLYFNQAPKIGAMITAGFEFDVPCRFDTDQLCIGLQHGELGSFSLPLLEIRLPLALDDGITPQ